MYSYNKIIALFSSYVENHQQLQTFGFGDRWEAVLHDQLDTFNYPLFFVVPTSSTIDRTHVNAKFQIIIADRVDSGENIENEVLSDMQQIALDTFSFLQNPVYSNIFKFNQSASYQPFTEGFMDNLTGVVLDIELKILNLNDRCAIPLSSGVTVDQLCKPVSIYNSSGTVLTTTVASGGSYLVPVGTVLRDGVLYGTVESGDTIDVPSAGGVTPPSVSVSLSSSTPVLGDSVTITATATNITATSYFFRFPNKSGGYDVITQLGNTYSWTVDFVGTDSVTVGVTDGTKTAWDDVGISVTVSEDPDGNTFISAHETATGVSMGDVQKSAIHELYFGLKGYNLSAYNYNDLYTSLDAAGSKFYPYCPTDDSTASAAAYQIELFNPSSPGTFVNFVGGDFTPDGVIGGSGKYLRMQVSPDDFNADSIGFDWYVKTVSSGNGQFDMGSFEANKYTIVAASHNGRFYYNMNSGSVAPFKTITAKAGLFSADRIFDEGLKANYNAEFHAVDNNSSIVPTTYEIYGHAYNGSGTAGAFSLRELNWLGVRSSLCQSEIDQLNFIIDRYQTNVITGGRNV